jgi:ADP-heptose:LPS heptosyltransferase
MKFAFLIIDLIILLFINKKKSVSNKIAIVKIDNIGDYVIWSDFIHSVACKSNNFIFICNSAYSELVPTFIKKMDLNQKLFKNNIRYRFTVLKEIRGLGIHTIIQPVSHRGFVAGDSIVRVSGASSKITLNSNKNFIKRIFDLFTYNKLFNYKKNSHQYDISRNMYYQYYDEELNSALPLNSSNKHNRNSKYCVFAIGASENYRKWSNFKWSKLAIKLLKEGYIDEIILVGSEVEVEDGDLISLKNDKVVNMCGQTDLMMLADLIENSLFIVGNESAAIHIAASINKTSFCILGGGHFGEFLPYPNSRERNSYCINKYMECYNCNWSCTLAKDKKYLCLSEIKVTDVFNLISEKFAVQI